MFDVIFCDPPFGMFDSVDLIDLASQHLTNDGLIYFESPTSKRNGFTMSTCNILLFNKIKSILIMIALYPGTFRK